MHHTQIPKISPSGINKKSLCLTSPGTLYFFFCFYSCTYNLKSFWEQLDAHLHCHHHSSVHESSDQGRCQSWQKAAQQEIWPGLALASTGTTTFQRSLSHCQCFPCRAGSGRTFLKCRGQQFYLLQLAIFRQF